jgi:hypothetical protein
MQGHVLPSQCAWWWLSAASSGDARSRAGWGAALPSERAMRAAASRRDFVASFTPAAVGGVMFILPRGEGTPEGGPGPGEPPVDNFRGAMRAYRTTPLGPVG